MPTLPAFTKRIPSISRIELDVRVPADDEPLLHPGERGTEPLVGRDAGQDLVVVRAASRGSRARRRARARAGARAGTRARADRGARRPSPRAAGARGDSRSAFPRTKMAPRADAACRGTPAGTALQRRRRRRRSRRRRASRPRRAPPRARAGCRARRQSDRDSHLSPRWRARADGWGRRRAGAARRRRRRGPGSRRR